MRIIRWIALFCIFGVAPLAGFAARAEDSPLSQWLDHLDARLPKSAADCAAGQRPADATRPTGDHDDFVPQLHAPRS